MIKKKTKKSSEASFASHKGSTNDGLSSFSCSESGDDENGHSVERETPMKEKGRRGCSRVRVSSDVRAFRSLCKLTILTRFSSFYISNIMFSSLPCTSLVARVLYPCVGCHWLFTRHIFSARLG